MFKKTVTLMLECYTRKFKTKNIFQVQDPIQIHWGHFSMLEADLMCMQLLMRKSVSWKALINFAGSEYPRFNNTEFVRRAKVYTSGYMRSVPMGSGAYYNGIKFAWDLVNTKFNPDKSSRIKPVKKTNKINPKPPFHLKIFTGVRSFILPRQWVKFLTTHPVARAYIDWSKNTYMPEEHVVHTLTRITKLEFINNTWIVEQARDDRYF